MIMYKERIQNALETQPDDGLRFECLEISCEEGVISDFRIYRKKLFGQTSAERAGLPGRISSFAEEIEKKYPGFALFDYSKREDQNYSLAFEPNRSPAYTRRSSFFPESCKLIQVGYIIGPDNQVLEEKEYYKINEEEVSVSDHIGEETHQLIKDNHYKPFMCGINYRGDDEEWKVYYMNAVTDLSRFGVEQPLRFFDVLGLEEEMHEIARMLYAKDLWLYGLARSDRKWRFYYFPK